MKTLFHILLGLLSFNSVSQNEDVITYFSASEFNGKVLLTWEITQGNTCNGVSVLHSTDSVNFSQIGSIQGICGSTLESISYEFTDISPEKNSINYYRLSLGGIGFSWIVSSEVIDLGANNVLLRPNPLNATSELHFDNETNALRTLSIYSSSGILLQTESTNTELFLLNKDEFDSGAYFFIISPAQSGDPVQGKFVVL